MFTGMPTRIVTALVVCTQILSTLFLTIVFDAGCASSTIGFYAGL